MMIAAVNLEEFKTIMVVVQLLVSVGMAWLLAIVNGKTKRIDTLESERGKLVDELKRVTGDVIDQKLSLITHRVQVLESSLVQSAADRMRLHDADHALRIEVVNAINALKDVVATKSDLDRLREEMNRG